MLDTSARLLRLLAVLQRRRHWGGPELAEHLEVTARTLRRDVDRLRSLGYVVEASAGPGGGYQLGPGRALPPLFFDDDEAVALAVALRSASDAFSGLSETVMAVLVKLEQAFPSRLRRRLGALDAVTTSLPGYSPAIDPRRLIALASACRDHDRLQFTYAGRDGRVAARAVEPARLAHTGDRRWYLLAFDLDRDDWRTFRVDRIEGAISRGPTFRPRRLPKDAAQLLSEALAPRAALRFRVRLVGGIDELASRVPRWCGELLADGPRRTLMCGTADSLEGLACRLLYLPVPYTLLEPAGEAPALAALAERLARGAHIPRTSGSAATAK